MSKSIKDIWKESSIYVKIALSVLMVIIMVLLTIINGYVVTMLWSWFIVPVFNLSQISIVQAIGLVFFVNFINHHMNKTTDKKVDPVTLIVMSLLKSLFGLAFGALLLIFL